MIKNRRLLIPLLLLAIIFGLTAANSFAANAGDQIDPQIQLVKKHLEFYGDIFENNRFITMVAELQLSIAWAGSRGFIFSRMEQTVRLHEERR